MLKRIASVLGALYFAAPIVAAQDAELEVRAGAIQYLLIERDPDLPVNLLCDAATQIQADAEEPLKTIVAPHLEVVDLRGIRSKWWLHGLRNLPSQAKQEIKDFWIPEWNDYPTTSSITPLQIRSGIDRMASEIEEKYGFPNDAAAAVLMDVAMRAAYFCDRTIECEWRSVTLRASVQQPPQGTRLWKGRTSAAKFEVFDFCATGEVGFVLASITMAELNGVIMLMRCVKDKESMQWRVDATWDFGVM